MKKIQPVILAGGTGSRLWPMSREMYPKQLLELVGDQSLLQNTLNRVAKLENILPPVLVVGEEHRFLTLSQVETQGVFSDFSILLEPVGRNSAPAIVAAIYYCAKADKDCVFLILPADHLVEKVENFIEAVEKAAELALKGAIVTFGIQPDSPETGYGYIECGSDGTVLSFTEKPSVEKAQEYIDSGRYCWNSGMFAFCGPVMLAEMEQFSSDILHTMKLAVDHGVPDDKFFRLEKETMELCTSDSIDYAVMEKTKLAAVVSADLGWSDIGSWGSLWQVSKKDENGNVVKGDNVITKDTKNSFVSSEKSLVATVGLEDTLVVETEDSVLVAPLSRSQEVKKIVAGLKKKGRSEYKIHPTVYRPWGSYTVLEEYPRFQIKRITVIPGAKLSLQMHHHRHEHWVVVTGTAKIVNGEKEILLQENASTYIPAGTVHRLENPGVIPLELIEVQIGSYLGEDDIVRFDDVYGRENDK